MTTIGPRSNTQAKAVFVKSGKPLKVLSLVQSRMGEMFYYVVMVEALLNKDEQWLQQV